MIRPRIGRRPGGPWLVVAGAIGLLAAAISLRAAAHAATGGRIVVARQPLAPGLLIDAGTAATALAAAPVPAGLPLDGVFADPAQVVGRRIAVPVAAGEPISDAALGGSPGSVPSPLAVGERAVAVPLSAAGGGGLVPGARVDVVASTGEGLAGSTAVVVGDAEVLAVAERDRRTGSRSGGEAPPEGVRPAGPPGHRCAQFRARGAPSGAAARRDGRLQWSSRGGGAVSGPRTTTRAPSSCWARAAAAARA